MKCRCGWIVDQSELVSGYKFIPPDDVEPCYKCPKCGAFEDTFLDEDEMAILNYEVDYERGMEVLQEMKEARQRREYGQGL